MRGVALSLGFFMLSLSVARGEVSGLPNSCAKYVEFLGAHVPAETVSQTCIPYEDMIMASKDWRAFVWNFERYFSRDGYPVQIELAMQAALNDNDGRALVHFDAAGSNALEIFVKINDRERAKVYFFLIVKNRNSLFRKYISDELFWAELKRARPPGPLNAFNSQTLENAGFLKCLIRLDAWTLPIEEVIESTLFQRCIKQTEE